VYLFFDWARPIQPSKLSVAGKMLPISEYDAFGDNRRTSFPLAFPPKLFCLCSRNPSSDLISQYKINTEPYAILSVKRFETSLRQVLQPGQLDDCGKTITRKKKVSDQYSK
jgi:hypothetical protein